MRRFNDDNSWQMDLQGVSLSKGIKTFRDKTRREFKATVTQTKSTTRQHENRYQLKLRHQNYYLSFSNSLGPFTPNKSESENENFL